MLQILEKKNSYLNDLNFKNENELNIFPNNEI